MINWNDNKLTDELKAKLTQGTKVKFKWHGSKSEYVGRIEVDQWGTLFFVSEENYQAHPDILESMRYYNRLDSFFHFTMFEILQ